MIYYTWDEHVKHLTTDAVAINLKLEAPRSFRGEDLNVKVYDERQTDAEWWQKLTTWAKKSCTIH